MKEECGEAEWLETSDPERMLDMLYNMRGRRDPLLVRKLRLFGCASCRGLWWNRLDDVRSRTAIEVAERYALYSASDQELRAACEASWEACSGLPMEDPAVAAFATATEAATVYVATRTRDRERQLVWLRDIFGNPFRVVRIASHWLSRDVVVLIQALCEERTFAGMPLLAERLEKASCDNEAILKHCRETSEHVLGCWVVDQLLASWRGMIAW